MMFTKIFVATSIFTTLLVVVHSRINGTALLQAVNDASAGLDPAIVAKFKDFIQNYNRSYVDLAEVKLRLRTFIDTYRRVINESLSTTLTNFTLGKYSDWSYAEKTKLLINYPLWPNHTIPRNVHRPRNGTVVVNRAIDWRDAGVVTPVEDQGDCGSCWAFAAAAVTESQYAIVKGIMWNETTLLPLSEQILLDCSSARSSCNGGYVEDALDYAIYNGIPPLDLYPYTGIEDANCPNTANSERVFINEWSYLPPLDLVAATNWLAIHGPVTAVMKIPDSFFDYSSGVYAPSVEECQGGNGNAGVHAYHAMAIVGFNMETLPNDQMQSYWILKNSWGENFGDLGGYVNVAMGDNTCGIEEGMVGVVGASAVVPI